MTNWYVNRDLLKDALAVTSTADHDQLDAVIEHVSREFERETHTWFYPRTQTRAYTALESSRVLVNDLLAITALRTDDDRNDSYETTWATANFYLAPANATLEQPPKPYWEIKLKNNSTRTFPVGVRLGVQVLGSFGWYDERDNASAAFATLANSTQLTIDVTNATAIKPGHTILVGSEQMFVQEVATAAAPASGGTLTVQRAVNGTSAATYSSGQAIQVYRYPVVERLALWQAERDYRAKDSPMGIVGGRDFSQEMHVEPGHGGLHPFVRRSLHLFRTPVAV